MPACLGVELSLVVDEFCLFPENGVYFRSCSLVREFEVGGGLLVAAHPEHQLDFFIYLIFYFVAGILLAEFVRFS